jgi:hypothetical protein
VDLKQYFRKLREIEASLSDAYLLVVSTETPDGGKPGLVSEVSREIAAKLIIEGRAVLASQKDAMAYREQQASARRAAEKADLARRVQVAIISEAVDRPITDCESDEPSNTRK